jgi:DNA-binding CsgD family transcriptional regulator
MTDVIEGDETPLEQVVRSAWRLSQATSGPDEDVAALFEHAASVILRRGDGGGAVAALKRAAELSAVARERVRRVGHAAYLDASLMGELRAAEQLLARTVRTGPVPSQPAEAALADSAILLYGDGDLAMARRKLDDTVAGFAQTPPDASTTKYVLRVLLLLGIFAGDGPMWASFRAALADAGPELEAHFGPIADILDDIVHAPRDGALARFETAIAQIDQIPDDPGMLRVAGVAAYVDRTPACRRALRRCALESAERGDIVNFILAQNFLAFDALAAGQWDEAAELADRATELSDSRGYVLFRFYTRMVSVQIPAHRGERDAVRRMTDEMIGWATPRHARLITAAALVARTRAAIGAADYEDAFVNAAKISPPGVLAVHTPLVTWVMLDLVEAALRTGREAEARAHVAAMRASAAGAVSSRVALQVEAATALTEPDDEAIVRFDRCLESEGIDQWPFDAARVHLLYGERLRRARSMAAAQTQLDAAFEIFQRLGAAPWAERAAKESRATGQNRMRHTEFVPEALTPQELQIALLAATGLSNKEIGKRLMLSHRTVGAHLYRAFPKLGISSRAALRDALADLT